MKKLLQIMSGMTLYILALMPVTAGAEAPGRIVSVGGSVTEILYALGLGDHIVATDTTSTWPEAAKQTPKIGYMRALSAEGVLSVKPDMIIMNRDAGPAPVLQQLAQTGVEILYVPAARGIEDIEKNIASIARRTGTEKAGIRLLEAIRADKVLLETAVHRNQHAPRVMFILQHGGGAPMVAGMGTAADSMIALAGAKNVVTEFTGYKPLTPEAAIVLQPDYILVTTLGLKQAGGLDAFARIPGLNLTKAAQEKRIVAMDALYLLGFGPRTVEAALSLRQKIAGGQL